MGWASCRLVSCRLPLRDPWVSALMVCFLLPRRGWRCRWAGDGELLWLRRVCRMAHECRERQPVCHKDIGGARTGWRRGEGPRLSWLPRRVWGRMSLVEAHVTAVRRWDGQESSCVEAVTEMHVTAVRRWDGQESSCVDYYYYYYHLLRASVRRLCVHVCVYLFVRPFIYDYYNIIIMVINASYVIVNVLSGYGVYFVVDERTDVRTTN